jgi:outer membrane biosynthesis protein TonB
VRIGIIIVVARGTHRAGVTAALAFAFYTALLAPGCGSSAEPRLSATAASQLQRGLSGVRVAAEGGDEAEALRALSSFSRLVSREARAGNLSASQARGLRTGISQARRRIEIEVATPAPAPTPPTSTPPPIPGPQPAPEQSEEAEEKQEEKKDEDEKEEKDDDKEEKGKSGKSEDKGGEED